MTEPVLVEQRGQVRWLIINREERRNALNEAVGAGLIRGIDEAEADPDCRAIVVTGAGTQAFCAGGDLQPNAQGAPFTVDPADPRNFVVRLLRRFEACRLPIVARVNGHALAGGLGLVCACDLAVASTAARFGTPESRLGLFPMMILPLMQRVLPMRRLLELCITGEQWTAEEALAMGLLNYVAPPEALDEKLGWLLSRILDKSPAAVRLGKMGFHAMRDMTLDQGFDYAQLMLPMMAQTKDAAEGFAAFREKRTPSWTGG
jgi:enoyl-CoA hydratase/carnithine racemase